jgi:hypothetical protein
VHHFLEIYEIYIQMFNFLFLCEFAFYIESTYMLKCIALIFFEPWWLWFVFHLGKLCCKIWVIILDIFKTKVPTGASHSLPLHYTWSVLSAIQTWNSYPQIIYLLCMYKWPVPMVIWLRGWWRIQLTMICDHEHALYLWSWIIIQDTSVIRIVSKVKLYKMSMNVFLRQVSSFANNYWMRKLCYPS